MPGAGQGDQKNTLFLVEGAAGAVPPAREMSFLKAAGDDPVELLALTGLRVEEVDSGSDRGNVVALQVFTVAIHLTAFISAQWAGLILTAVV